MSTSALPAVIDYLVDRFTAAGTLGAATPPVPVYDGPQALDPGQVVQALYVAVDNPGMGDDSSQGPVAAEFAWRWASLGAKTRYEQISVPCTAVHIDAGGSLRTARDGCMSLFAAADAVIVPGDLTLGGLVVVVTGMTRGELRTEQFDVGAVAWLTFVVEVQSRI